jgi:hypothetical protein
MYSGNEDQANEQDLRSYRRSGQQAQRTGF